MVILKHLSHWVSSPLPHFPPQGGNRAILKHLAHWVSDESVDKLKTPLDTSGWKLECPRSGVPQQYNEVDCGVFIIM